MKILCKKVSAKKSNKAIITADKYTPKDLVNACKHFSIGTWWIVGPLLLLVASGLIQIKDLVFALFNIGK